MLRRFSALRWLCEISTSLTTPCFEPMKSFLPTCSGYRTLPGSTFAVLRPALYSLCVLAPLYYSFALLPPTHLFPYPIRSLRGFMLCFRQSLFTFHPAWKRCNLPSFVPRCLPVHVHTILYIASEDLVKAGFKVIVAQAVAG